MMCLGFFVVLFSLVNVLQAAVFSCTNSNIGSLPSNANSTVTVPIGTNCTFTISTPVGYGVRFQITATPSNNNDNVTLIDPNGTLIPIVNATNGIRQFSTRGTTKIQVLGSSGASTFFATYDFFAITGYTQKSFNTGDVFQLSLTVNSYYTITSVRNDSIIASVAKLSSAAVDSVFQQIFVFDGADIVNSQFLGRLGDVADYSVASTSNKMTIVNFYNTPSTNYFLANDASTVSQLNKYTVFRMSSEGNIRGNVRDLSTKGAAYTFICTDCDTFYLGSLTFDSMSTISNIGYIELSGMSPTHRLPGLLNYPAQTFTDNQLPQIVPVKMFTMYTYMSGIVVGFTTMKSWQDRWQAPYVGRKGVMVNPALWNPTQSPAFTYTIADTSNTFTYSLKPSNLSFTSNSDSLQVSLLSSTGVATTQKTFSSNDVNANFSGVGYGMKVQLQTGVHANVRMNFEILEGNSTARLMGWTTVIVLLYKLLF